MQNRQLRLGDILDDYCPRERRVTNHAIVAMIDQDVKQTRCTTCDAEHEYKHARVPRQRRKAETPAALTSQPSSVGPKRVVHEPDKKDAELPAPAPPEPAPTELHAEEGTSAGEESAPEKDFDLEEGPVHRQLIRATLPRPEGQPPPQRPAPDFTLRQPTGRQGRFRPRHTRGASQFHGNRSGNVGGGGGMPRGGGGNRQPMMSRSGKRHGPPGHKRSK